MGQRVAGFDAFYFGSVLGGESSSTSEEGGSCGESTSIEGIVSGLGSVDCSIHGFLSTEGLGRNPLVSFHFSLTGSVSTWFGGIGEEIRSGIIPCEESTRGVGDLAMIFDEVLINFRFFFFAIAFFSLSLSSSAFFGGGVRLGMGIIVKGTTMIGCPGCWASLGWDSEVGSMMPLAGMTSLKGSAPI